MQKPILKPKPIYQQLSLSPQPPIEHREIPKLWEQTTQQKRVKLSLRESIDPDKLTPTGQAKLAAGVYGSIVLRTDVKDPYYVVRWKDPNTGSRRSTKLAHTWEAARAKLRELTGCST
jgi:hypothetical protein